MAYQGDLNEDGLGWILVGKYITPRTKSSKLSFWAKGTIKKARAMKKRPAGRRLGFERMWLVLNIPAEYGTPKGRNIMDFPWWYSSVFFQRVCWLGSHRCSNAFLKDQCLANRKDQKRKMGLWKGVGIESADCRCRIISKHKYLTYHFLAVLLPSSCFTNRKLVNFMLLKPNTLSSSPRTSWFQLFVHKVRTSCWEFIFEKMVVISQA